MKVGSNLVGSRGEEICIFADVGASDAANSSTNCVTTKTQLTKSPASCLV